MNFVAREQVGQHVRHPHPDEETGLGGGLLEGEDPRLQGLHAQAPAIRLDGHHNEGGFEVGAAAAVHVPHGQLQGGATH